MFRAFLVNRGREQTRGNNKSEGGRQEFFDGQGPRKRVRKKVLGYLQNKGFDGTILYRKNGAEMTTKVQKNTSKEKNRGKVSATVTGIKGGNAALRSILKKKIRKVG